MKRFGAATVAVVLIIFAFTFLNREHISPPQFSKSFIGTNSTAGSSTPVTVSSGDRPGIPFTLPSGFTIHVFAKGLGQARDLQFSPGGTLLVSDPNGGSVYVLPDKNGDGVSDNKKTVISGENHPHGLAFYGGKLYVADSDRVVSYSWDEANLAATGRKVLFSLPQNNDHNNRTITFDLQGKMYVSVGSTCNVCNENSNFSATVLVSDAVGNNPRVFASGLRNAPFIQFNPKTGELWGTEMGRDYLGDSLPPDEINIITEGANYGWPNCYGDKVPDTSFNQNATCRVTQSPIYKIPAHSAPLGLTFINSLQFPADWQGDLLVAYHGSWNRTLPTGYKVVHMKVNGNTIGDVSDFLTGFIGVGAKSGSDALGRPVDLLFDKSGNLFLSDDKAGNIYIIQKQ